MGLLRRLVGEKPGTPLPKVADDASAASVSLSISTEERVNVVGESHYQDAIRSACNWKQGEDTAFDCMAELVPEPTNKYDTNAIMVKIDHRQVGYLSRKDAAEFGPHIAASIQEQGTGMVRAFIAGRGDGETDNLGVFLHMNVTRPVEN